MSILKIFIKSILYYSMNFFVLSSKEICPKTLLLIRFDAIGDYVLFRNFIEFVKTEYRGYKITFVANTVWKEMAEEFDAKFIDEFIWLDRSRFEKDFRYRYRILKEISNKGYQTIINPTYSRSFFADDSIVKAVTAAEKIGSIGDLNNIKKWQKNISDTYYTRLIPAKNEILFEFYRNKEFFEYLLNKKLDIEKSTIRLKEKKLDFNLSENYTILFIGASDKFRKWDIENFVEVGKYLKEKYNYNIVVCGGPADTKDAAEFKELAVYEYTDLVGKTSLIDLLYVIQNSSLMLTNETSAPHCSVALDIPNVFVVSNGNHFGRFTPYPDKITQNYYVIYHPEIEKDLDNYKKLSNCYGYGSQLDINEINVDTVIKKIDKVLNV